MHVLFYVMEYFDLVYIDFLIYILNFLCKIPYWSNLYTCYLKKNYNPG